MKKKKKLTIRTHMMMVVLARMLLQILILVTNQEIKNLPDLILIMPVVEIRKKQELHIVLPLMVISLMILMVVEIHSVKNLDKKITLLIPISVKE